MEIRNIVKGEVYFFEKDAKRANELIKHFSSAVRSGYQAKNKHNLKDNEIVKYVKKNYMNLLNQRYINDACMMAKMVNQEHALFGGKRNWKNLQTKTITKEEWINNRNNQLYSRGDKLKNGNPNIRIVGNELWVKEPLIYKGWIKGKLFIQKDKTLDLSIYDVRLIRKDNNKFLVIASNEVNIVPMEFNDNNGVIGIDSNPDGIAMVETDKSGNILNHKYILKQRIQFAEENKRKYDICILAKEVVEFAKSKNKPIILEQLEFKQKDQKTNKFKTVRQKKFRRMKSNFLFRKIIEAIKSRALKEKVAVKEVNPAFTSILGQLKYQKMYSLNRHTSAALVIGRRGMDIKEKQTFSIKEKTDKQEKSDKDILNLEGRDISIDLTRKAWSWMQDRFLQTKPVIPTGSCLVPLKEAQSTITGEIPVDESITTTGRYGSIKHTIGAERTPCKIEESY